MTTPTTSRRRFLSFLGIAGAATAATTAAVVAMPAAPEIEESKGFFENPTEYLAAMESIGWTPTAMFSRLKEGEILRMGVNESAPNEEWCSKTWGKFHAISMRCPVQSAYDLPQGDWWKEVWQFLYDRGLREEVTPPNRNT